MVDTTQAVAQAPYWLQFVQPFGTVFLGIGAFFLGTRQWRTANEKLRLDLFDRRFEAVSNCIRFIEIYKGVNVELIRATNSEDPLRVLELLFGSEIISYTLALNRLLYEYAKEDHKVVTQAVIKKDDLSATIRRDEIRSSIVMVGHDLVREADAIMKVSGVVTYRLRYRMLDYVRAEKLTKPTKR